MKFTDEMTSDFRTIHGDMPAQVALGGRILDALVSEADQAELLDAGGFLPERALSVKLLRADLASLPQVGQSLTCNNRRYRIERVSHKSASPFVNLECQQQ